MTNTSLDLSLRLELAPWARVIADVQAAAEAMGIATLIAGAFARDLHLLYAHGISMQRRTEDIDFALAVPDWDAFAALRERLIAGGAFQAAPSVAHRLRHRDGLPVDLVPFDGVETGARTIAWPPRGEFVMDVLGYREALATANQVLLPGNKPSLVVALPALALLKIVCWQDRHYQWPRKDAHDLQMIVQHYLAAGNEVRLWDEFAAWTAEDDFDYHRAGARMLGHDISGLLDRSGFDRVAKILVAQIGPDAAGVLLNEMNPHNPDLAHSWLAAVLQGLTENSRP